MSKASVFLWNWVRKNIMPTAAHIRDDKLTGGPLIEKCLGEARAEGLSAAEVTDAAGGNPLTFMIAQLNRHVPRDPGD